MDDVVTLSSGSDEDDSDVEIVGNYTENKVDAKPFIKGDWVNIAANNATLFLINLKETRCALPGHAWGHAQTPIQVVDLIDDTATTSNNNNNNNNFNLPENNESKGLADKSLTTLKGGSTSLDNTSKGRQQGDSTIAFPVQGTRTDIPKSKQGFSGASMTEVSDQKDTKTGNYINIRYVSLPIFRLRRFPLSEINFRKWKASGSKQYSDCPNQLDSVSSNAAECIDSSTNTIPKKPQLNPPVGEPLERCVTSQEQVENQEEPLSTQSPSDDPLSVSRQRNPHCFSDKGIPTISSENCSTYEAEISDFYSATLCPNEATPATSSPQEQTQGGSYPRDPSCSSPSSLLFKASSLRSLTPTRHPQTTQQQHPASSPQPDTSAASPCHSIKSQAARTHSPTSTRIPSGESPELEEAEADLTMNSPARLCDSIPTDPLSVPRTEDVDVGFETRGNRIDTGSDSLVHGEWQDGGDGEQEMDFADVSPEDGHYTCPIGLGEVMAGSTCRGNLRQNRSHLVVTTTQEPIPTPVNQPDITHPDGTVGHHPAEQSHSQPQTPTVERHYPVRERKLPKVERHYPVRERKLPKVEIHYPVRERKLPKVEIHYPVRERKLPKVERHYPVRERKLPKVERHYPVRERKLPKVERHYPVRERKLPKVERHYPVRERKLPKVERHYPVRERKLPRYLKDFDLTGHSS